MTDVFPNRCGEPFALSGRGGGQVAYGIHKGRRQKHYLKKWRQSSEIRSSWRIRLWRFGNLVEKYPWILERISKVQIYDGKDFVELDGRGLRELIERELFYP
jgi:hypothetical protein